MNPLQDINSDAGSLSSLDAPAKLAGIRAESDFSSPYFLKRFVAGPLKDLDFSRIHRAQPAARAVIALTRCAELLGDPDALRKAEAGVNRLLGDLSMREEGKLRFIDDPSSTAGIVHNQSYSLLALSEFRRVRYGGDPKGDELALALELGFDTFLHDFCDRKNGGLFHYRDARGANGEADTSKSFESVGYALNTLLPLVGQFRDRGRNMRVLECCAELAEILSTRVVHPENVYAPISEKFTQDWSRLSRAYGAPAPDAWIVGHALQSSQLLLRAGEQFRGILPQADFFTKQGLNLLDLLQARYFSEEHSAFSNVCGVDGKRDIYGNTADWQAAEGAIAAALAAKIDPGNRNYRLLSDQIRAGFGKLFVDTEKGIVYQEAGLSPGGGRQGIDPIATGYHITELIDITGTREHYQDSVP